MLNTNERILLRDELFDKFKQIQLIYYNKRFNTYQYYNKKTLSKKLETYYPNILIEYKLYLNDFSSEEEALYCLLRHDDISNHLCPICGKPNTFYNLNHGYRNSCGNKKCIETIVQSDEAKKKRENTNLNRYGHKSSASSEQVKATMKANNLAKYGYESVSQIPEKKEKMKNTNRNKWGYDCTLQHPDIQAKAKASRKRKYGDENYNNHKQALETYMKNHCVPDPITLEECNPLLNQIKEGLSCYETYSNRSYFARFIKLLYQFKGRLLKIDEVRKVFGLSACAIGQRLHELELEEYFNIPDSKLELQFRDFLITNNYKEKDHFLRKKFRLETDHNTRQQLDFLFENYNIAFEINDVNTHNIRYIKDNPTYHLNKSLLTRKQLNTHLIHLWEWELNDSYWPKISQWVLHILSQNKVEILLKDCILKQVTKEEQIDFINQYDLNVYQNSFISLGLYYNNELIQLLSFIYVGDNKWYLSNICTKFGYNIKDGYKSLINYFKNFYKSILIYTYVDISKFNSNEYKDIGFQFFKRTNPIIISQNIIENKKETCKSKQLYNCGYDIMFIN